MLHMLIHINTSEGVELQLYNLYFGGKNTVFQDARTLVTVCERRGKETGSTKMKQTGNSLIRESN